MSAHGRTGAVAVLPAMAAACMATEPLTLRLAQRTSATLPGTSGPVSVGLGDITGGRVDVSVWHGDETTAITNMRMKAGDHLPFTMGEHQRLLRHDRIENALVGEDYAMLSVIEAQPVAQTEHEKVLRLIRAVEGLDGAKFIRNGSPHPPAEAAKHLRKKLDAAGDRVRTAYDFLDGVASRSSLSGEPYLVEYPDGRQIPAADFLRAELARIESGP
ncbi:MAG: DUF5329 domain-containing protein [Candidatus Sumerlaeaceae bacterium]|nr:DUF5329 domain-containing protein [Candidatus Sumerlaeaceae bacterium]